MPVTRDLSHLNIQIRENITFNERDIARKRAARKLLLSPAYSALWSHINAQFKIGYTGSEGSMWIYRDVPGFTYVDNPELFNFLAQFDPEDITIKDQPEASVREFRIKIVLLKQEFFIHLSCTLTDNAICQRVVIGEEETQDYVLATVRKPVYAFKC